MATRGLDGIDGKYFNNQNIVPQLIYDKPNTLSMKSLPDTAIMRLIEVSMEEMLLFESKNKMHENLSQHPLRKCQILKT